MKQYIERFKPSRVRGPFLFLLGTGVNAVGQLDDWAGLRENMETAWNFILTPLGNLVLIVAGLGWLAYRVTRNEPRSNQDLDAAVTQLSGEVLRLRRHLSAMHAHSIYMHCRIYLEAIHNPKADEFKDWGKTQYSAIWGQMVNSQDPWRLALTFEKECYEKFRELGVSSDFLPDYGN